MEDQDWVMKRAAFNVSRGWLFKTGTKPKHLEKQLAPEDLKAQYLKFALKEGAERIIVGLYLMAIRCMVGLSIKKLYRRQNAFIGNFFQRDGGNDARTEWNVCIS